MDREALAPFLALVILVNVAAIAFVLSGSRLPRRSRRPERVDAPVPNAAAWDLVLTAESSRHARLGRPATDVALELVGVDVIAERDGAAR
jgi:hypothetical protein